jgi:ribose transport system substrate-binding protein
MRNLRALALTVVVGAGIVMAGCGSSDDGGSTAAATGTSAAATSTEPAGGGKPVDAAYITYALTDFIEAEKQGVESVLKPAGGSVRVYNANFDPQKQLQQCQDAISSGRYNAILLGAVSSPTGVPCVTAAKAAGIPVVTIEPPVGKNQDTTEIETPGVVGSVTLAATPNADNMVEITKLACQDLDPCNIIAEVATPTDYFTNEVVKRVKAEVPNATILQTISGQYDPSVVLKAFSDALAAHPDVNVFLSAADTQALAVVPALKQAGKLGQVKLLGNGGSRLGAKAVADGTMFATAGNWPHQQGAIAAKMMTQAVNGETVDPSAVDAITIDEPRVVTKDTVGQFKAEWGAE